MRISTHTCTHASAYALKWYVLGKAVHYKSFSYNKYNSANLLSTYPARAVTLADELLMRYVLRFSKFQLRVHVIWSDDCCASAPWKDVAWATFNYGYSYMRKFSNTIWEKSHKWAELQATNLKTNNQQHWKPLKLLF